MMRSRWPMRAILIVVLILLAGFTVSAALDSEGQRVFDFSGLLSSQEEEALESRIVSLSAQLNLDIIIVTIDDAEGKSSQSYADDFYDAYDFGTMSGQEYPSGILLLLDMDNREIYLSTETEQEIRFSDREIDLMLDSIYDNVAAGNYYSACTSFLHGVGRYGTENIPASVEGKGSSWGIRLLISILIGAVSTFLMVCSSKAKMTAKGRTYLSGKGVNVIGRNDRFTHTTVVKRKIQTNNSSGSSGGGARTHSSSSGRSHGGGGRKF